MSNTAYRSPIRPRSSARTSTRSSGSPSEFARTHRQRHPRGVLMPAATPSCRPQADRAAQRRIPSISIVGDDEAEMSRLAADLSALVEDELRAFNLERLYATEKA